MRKSLLAATAAVAVGSSALAHPTDDTLCDRTSGSVHSYLQSTFVGLIFPIGDSGIIRSFDKGPVDTFYHFVERGTHNYVCTSTFRVAADKGPKVMRVDWRVQDLGRGRVNMPDNLQIREIE
jgi:hypothetical protein